MSIAITADMTRESALIGARIDRLPTWGVSNFSKVIFVAAYFSSFYDSVSVGLVLPNITKTLPLTGGQEVWPVTTGLVGYVIGALLLGRTGDKIGRRAALFISMTIMAVFCVLSGFAWNAMSLSVFRFVLGIGIGAQLSLSATFMNELSPSHERDINIQRNFIWSGLAMASTPFLILAFNLTGPDLGWRLTLGIGGLTIIPAVLLLLQPESPRWLVTRGRNAKAEEAVKIMEDRLQRRGFNLSPVLEAPPVEAVSSKVSSRILFRKPYVSRLAVITIFFVFGNIVGTGELAFITTILNMLSHGKQYGVLMSAAGGLMLPVGAALPLFLLNKISRRLLMALGCWLFALGTILIGASLGVFVTTLGTAVIGLGLLSGIGVGYIYASEIFPTTVRASALGFADGLGHLGGMGAPALVFVFLERWGARGALDLMAGIEIVAGLFIVAFGVRNTETLATEDFS